jgi:hypothetical protein
MQRNYTRAFIGLFVAVSLTSCTSSDDGFKSHDEAQEDYESSASELKMPEGITFPGFSEPEEETVYEGGVGLIDSQWHWLCAWQAEWLDAFGEGDDIRAVAALGEIEKAPDMEFFSEKHFDDVGRELFVARLEQARLDDPSGMQQDVDVNCAGLTG